jgi:transposase
MKVHANAPLGPKGRLVLCRRVEEEGWSLRAAAEAAGLRVRSAGKWLARYRREGERRRRAGGAALWVAGGIEGGPQRGARAK